jgi:exportin-5
MDTDGAFDTYWQPSVTSESDLNTIQQALHLNLSPSTPNDVRQQALAHLEQVKNQPDAPQYGFTLAEDWNQPDAVRYYGLQLLNHAIRYRWPDYSSDQADQLRTWTKCLAGSLRIQDALYIRNKVAQVWAELAKRCWGGDEPWTDMDVLLVNLWDEGAKEAVNRPFVMDVLGILSEDVVLGAILMGKTLPLSIC